VIGKLLASVPDAVRSRIHIRGMLSNEELVAEYQKGRILFMPSRSEGSSIAAEEALACGCSVVGGAHIFCMRNFVSKNTGTLAGRYSTKGMAEALSAEIRAWEENLRDPEWSSALWYQEVNKVTVTMRILSILQKPLKEVDS
jgi:glycosyltransferase involved in cell wall biosynthesis